MKKSLAVTLVLVFAATSSYAQSRRGHSGGGQGGRGHGGDRAVARGHAPGRGSAGAAVRRPNPGGGSSYHRGGGSSYGRSHGSYGRGYGYSNGRSHGYYNRGYGYYGRGYGYGHYSRYRSYPYYRGYPYYGYGYYPPYGYGYYPWSYGLGLGVDLSFGSGYDDAGYGAPYVEYPRGSSWRGDEPAEEYVERGEQGEGRGAETGELRLTVVGAEDAVVYVDDEFRGIASRLGSVRVTPGSHRVEVIRPGYAIAEREVHVGRGATASLQIDLERR